MYVCMYVCMRAYAYLLNTESFIDQEEELKIREDSLSVRESQVQSKENFIFNHLRDMTKKEVRVFDTLMKTTSDMYVLWVRSTRCRIPPPVRSGKRSF